MLSRKQLAKELGVSLATVSKNEARGMPVDDVERARRWRKRHLQHGRMKGVRRDTLSQVIVCKRLHQYRQKLTLATTATTLTLRMRISVHTLEHETGASTTRQSWLDSPMSERLDYYRFGPLKS